jgi:hypothetical protein
MFQSWSSVIQPKFDMNQLFLAPPPPFVYPNSTCLTGEGKHENEGRTTMETIKPKEKRQKMLSAAALHGTAYLTRDEIFLHPYLQSGPSLNNLQNSFF